MDILRDGLRFVKSKIKFPTKKAEKKKIKKIKIKKKLFFKFWMSDLKIKKNNFLRKDWTSACVSPTARASTVRPTPRWRSSTACTTTLTRPMGRYLLKAYLKIRLI
jgi:hypothetical protein